MKNLLTFVLMLISILAFSQKGSFSLNILSSVDYSKSAYTYPGGYLEKSIKSTFPLGNTFGLNAEWGLNKKISTTIGLHYSKKNLFPRLNLGFVYGGIENPIDGSWMSSPYLAQHSFELMTIPLGFKFKVTDLKRLHPYFKVGATVNFRFNEVESYQSTIAVFDGSGELSDSDEKVVSFKDDEFKFFSTSFDFGIGLEYAITSRWNIIFEHNISAWEFRKGNEKFKKNGTFLFDDAIITFSRLSLGLGVLYEFGER